MKKILLGAAFAMALSQVNAAPDPNFHIYLAFGQSNMEGQGDIGQQDKSVDDRFQVLWAADNGSCSGKTKGKWSTAVPPLAHCQGAKLGPTDYFGRTMVEKTDSQIKVGVIVVAVAGCSIDLFDKNNYANYARSQQSWMTQPPSRWSRIFPMRQMPTPGCSPSRRSTPCSWPAIRCA